MTETCKANGISEFGRTRGGWMKMVEGIDKTQKGGYSFIGDNFFKAGNFKTNFPNGIYLDQSTDKEKNLTMNLFSIENGNVTLIKSVPKTNGWAENLWDDVDNYFHTKTEVTSQDIINTIKEMTEDPDIIEDVITKLSAEKSESHYAFKNWYEVKSILYDMECFQLPIETIETFVEKLITRDTYIFKCKPLCSVYPYRKYITASAKVLYKLDITENTPIDYRKITPTTFRSKHFQNEIKTKQHPQYIARTIPNATGYHNGIEVTIFYVEDNTLCIREFSYYIDTYKAGQIGDEILTPTE